MLKYLLIKKFLFSIFLINTFLISSSLYSQNITSDKLILFRSMIIEKGIDETKLINNLKIEGIDINTMKEDEIVSKRSKIEEIVNKMEKELITNQSKDDSNLVDKKLEPSIDPELEFIVKNDTLSKRIYGHEMFKNNSIESSQISKDASPPDSYIIAPGDKINILIFGKSQGDFYFEVNSDGYIKPNLMPKIFISGLTLKQARKMLKLRFSTYYVFNEDQFALTLNTSRTITVSVFGEVKKKGSYTSSALNTVLSILSIAGGPTDLGSVRNIQIIRGNEKKTLDLYSFMNNPELQYDFFLNNNDIIYVEPVKKLISFEGAVNREMFYELKENEGLIELIDYAGGINSNAYTGVIQVKSIDNNKITLNDYSLNDILNNKSYINLKNGDIVTVKEINNVLVDYVSILGAVEYQGDYSLNDSSTLNSLLNKAGLKPNSANYGYVLRTNPYDSKNTTYTSVNFIEEPNFKLQSGDKLVVLDKNEFKLEESVSILGDVKNEINLRYDSTLTLKDILTLAGGTTISSNLNEVDVFRLDFNLNKNPLKYNITLKLDDEFNILNKPFFSLKPYDVIVVRTLSEFQMIETVKILGEVLKTGNFIVESRGFHFSDLINRSKGFTSYADIRNIILTRNYNNEGLIVFDPIKAINNPKTSYDPILKENDLINVPSINNIVEINTKATNYILGDNQKTLKIIYSGNRTAKWYINKYAGGFDINVNKKSLNVKSSNGLITGTKKFLFFYNYPKVEKGDVIMINYKVKKNKNKDRKPFNWDNLSTKMMSFATLALLVKQLSSN
tara:strand:+ start:133 stop:2496 length:2364 start_codon:yes stop_codon:yes gene_type:complete